MYDQSKEYSVRAAGSDANLFGNALRGQVAGDTATGKLTERPPAHSLELIILDSQNSDGLVHPDETTPDDQFELADVLKAVWPKDAKLHLAVSPDLLVGFETDRFATEIPRPSRTNVGKSVQAV
jgi:hypothetical protein